MKLFGKQPFIILGCHADRVAAAESSARIWRRSGRSKGLSALCIALILSTAASAQKIEPRWEADQKTGCKVWNPNPEPGESVSWSGACREGHADGHGVTQWFKDGNPGNRIEGEFVSGRSKGRVTITYPNGAVYVGELDVAGNRAGDYCELILPNGARYSGACVKGEATGEKAEAFRKSALQFDEEKLGPDHPDVAASLNNLTMLYYSQGRYSEAEMLLKRVLSIRDKALGLDHPDVATILHDLSGLYYIQGRYSEAEPLLKRTLSIQEKLLGSNHPDVAAILHSLAQLHSYQGRYADAESLYKRALAIQGAIGPDHSDLATSLYNLAQLYVSQGRYADAEPLYKRTLLIYEKALGPDHLSVGTSLSKLAQLYVSQDRYADAEPHFRRSLTIQEEALGPDHPDVATTLDNLAHLYYRQGRYADAEPLFKRVLSFREKNLGPKHPDVATACYSLATNYSAMGRYIDADRFFKRALDIQLEILGQEAPGVAELMNNLALNYGRLGRYADAKLLLERALAINEKRFGQDHWSVATAINNVADNYQSMGDYAEAERLFKRALSLHEKTRGPEHRDVAAPLANLASIYIRAGRYQEAELLLKRALSVTEKALGSEHPKVAEILTPLSASYYFRERYAEAEPLLQRALGIDEKVFGSQNQITAKTLENLVFFYVGAGRHAEALPFLNRLLKNNRSFSAERALLLLSHARDRTLIPSPQAFADSYKVLQLGRSSAAGEAVARLGQRIAVDSNELAMLVRENQDLDARQSAVDKKLISAFALPAEKRNREIETDLRKQLNAISQERDQIEQTLTRQFPEYAALTRPALLSLEETRTVLGAEEAVVAFYFSDGLGYAWAVTREQSTWSTLQINGKQLAEQVQKLRVDLSLGDSKAAGAFDAQRAHELYKSLFGPVASTLAGKKRLTILADGALTSLPLSLLVTEEPTTNLALKDVAWFAKSYAITYIPSIFSLKVMREQAGKRPAPMPMIAFADPVFSKKAQQQAALRSLPDFYVGQEIDIGKLSEELGQLPATKAEVEAVGAALKAARGDIKTGTAATETAVKQAALDQYRVVYFATHAMVAGELQKFAKAKAEPALILTIPDKPTTEDDGLLQASEVAMLKLNADWVVLSACNTAAGDSVGAEALSGLARAFLYAGAKSLVVSHWEVDDRATANLMTRLFKIAADNPTLSHGEALQQAMLQMLAAATGNIEAHPRNWAAFTVVGEPTKRK